MGRLDGIEVIDDQGRFRVPLPEFVELGERIMELFEEKRPLYTPGAVRIPKKAYPRFYAAAILCREEGLEPEVYVDLQLKAMAKTGKFWPSAIASPILRELVPDHNILWVRMVRHYKSQLTLFEERSILFGPRLTLEDMTNQFTPLFRCVMAQHHGYEDIVTEFAEVAQQELKENPVAKEAFGELVGFLNDR